MSVKIRMSPGEVMTPNYLDARPYAYYDRLILRAGETMPEWVPLFHQPIGFNRPGSWDFKTIEDTNMLLPGSLPAPCSLKLNTIGFVRKVGCDLSELRRSFRWRFSILHKEFASGPFPEVWQGALCEYMIGESRTVEVLRGFTLAIPPDIESMMYFKFEIVGTPFVTKNDIDLLVFLDGEGTFAVQ